MYIKGLALVLAGSSVLSALAPSVPAPPSFPIYPTPVPTLIGTLQLGKLGLNLPLSAFLLTRTQGANADNVCLQFANAGDKGLFDLAIDAGGIKGTITLKVVYEGVTGNPSQILTLTNLATVRPNPSACCGTGGQLCCSSFNATTTFSQTGTPWSGTQGNYQVGIQPLTGFPGPNFSSFDGTTVGLTSMDSSSDYFITAQRPWGGDQTVPAVIALEGSNTPANPYEYVSFTLQSEGNPSGLNLSDEAGELTQVTILVVNGAFDQETATVYIPG
jgi:hypothetical protein